MDHASRGFGHPADGSSIRDYVKEAATEHDLDRRIRFKSKVVSADWSSETARWTVEIKRADTGERMRMSCGFLFGCTGYYRYDEGYTPDFEGVERFKGQIVHPQHWPEDLDYADKRVLIIGRTTARPEESCPRPFRRS